MEKISPPYPSTVLPQKSQDIVVSCQHIGHIQTMRGIYNAYLNKKEHKAAAYFYWLCQLHLMNLSNKLMADIGNNKRYDFQECGEKLAALFDSEKIMRGTCQVGLHYGMVIDRNAAYRDFVPQLTPEAAGAIRQVLIRLNNHKIYYEDAAADIEAILHFNAPINTK